ncbi:NAD(P)H-binding protein [Chitinolyticbacter meiyuanensis]|uniref:NAD(P)H-binding protein n=1 Tax=Chitinolyticbacter meiyuanensis TaxID=682798 RepID=UPI0016526B53|nr:NAD(P)H-binding protein [Chitinolyticbacter meiyuanensis]
MAELILVVGATGGTGRHVVDQLLAQGRNVRLLVRDASAAQARWPDADIDTTDVLSGDLTPAFAGITAVISTLGSREPEGLRLVDLPATLHLVAAAQAAGVTRFVLCSTIGAVPTPGVPQHLLAAFAPKGEAEAALRNSGLPYAIVRPGQLVDEAAQEARAIERARVATALIAALDRAGARNTIHELSHARLAVAGADPVLGLAV